jgi:hypothetical protein
MDLNQAYAVRVAHGGQPAVPGEPAVEGFGQEFLGRFLVSAAVFPSAVDNVAQGDGVYRRLADAAAAYPVRQCSGLCGSPPVEAWKVVGVVVTENDVGDHAGGPLGVQQGSQLGDGTGDAGTGQADGDEGGVPAPHMGIEVGCGAGHGAQVVDPQDFNGSGAQLFHGQGVGRVHLASSAIEVSRS